MTDKVLIERLRTGVPGLDDVLAGGLSEFSFNVIGGPPGSGKTTLAHQMMFAMATPTRQALYFTMLGEAPLKMLRYQQQFDFFDGEALNHTIHFVSLVDDAMSDPPGQMLERIAAAVEAHQPSLVFIDSFRSSLWSTRGDAGTQRDTQRFLQQLGTLMTSWLATTFLIGDFEDGNDANPALTIADGLIRLHQSVDRNSMVRKLEIVKMRGQPALPGLHTFRICASGINVFAPAAAVVIRPENALLSLDDVRLRTGVPRLDEMMNGGLPRGYSMLVAGPSGSGKTILAAAFLTEGARRGETGVVAAFEQHPARARDRTLANLIAGGQVSLVDGSAADLSIDEIVLLVMNDVRRLGATRVVIDSLSGFELALAPTFREDFRESLLRMVSALAVAGVTMLMTSELEDRYTDLRFSPHGTAFLTDAIVVQRYIEVDSQLRRVLAVVKLRASAHSHELREFTIDDKGLHIGDMLPDHEGLLGGRPTRKRVEGRLPGPPTSAGSWR